jgi:hypothetical protein
MRVSQNFNHARPRIGEYRGPFRKLLIFFFSTASRTSFSKVSASKAPARTETSHDRYRHPNNAQNHPRRRYSFHDIRACYVQAVSLMPVRGLPLQLIIPRRRILKTMGDWYQFCFYNNLDNDLKAGRAMTYGPVGGKPISVAEGHQIVMRARALGWLEP